MDISIETRSMNTTTNTAQHPLLANLTLEQREAVTTTASPLCIVAGAGSGKTRVLTHRIAWHITEGNFHHQQVLAVTFTRQAARELRLRLRQLKLRSNVRAGTFHSIALSQIRRFDSERRRRPWQILSNPTHLVAALLNEQPHRWQGIDPTEWQRSRTRTWQRTRTRDIVNEINWAQARLITPVDYPTKAAAFKRQFPLGDAERFASFYKAYQQAKRRKRILDFNDVLEMSLHLMNTEAQYADSQRWLNQHLLVDEFQDINPLQFALLKSWLGDNSTLVMVGDHDQAIYSWNGSDPKLIGNIQEHFPGCTMMKLCTNFRSTPEILATAGRILDKPPQPAFRQSGKPPTVTVLSDDTKEPAALARAVRICQPPGAPWNVQAVLARTNAQLTPLREALIGHSIPVTMKRDAALKQQHEIECLINDWRNRNSNPNQAHSYPRRSRSQPHSQTRRDSRAYSHSQLPQSHQSNISLRICIADTQMSLQTPLNVNEDHTHMSFTWQREAKHQDEDTVASTKKNIRAFLDFAEDHLSVDPEATVESFLADTRFDQPSIHSRNSNGVNLLTFHAAKGLEWSIVHLVGLEDGYVPIASSHNQQALHEEQRLLYVATTRALKELHVMWCSKRTISGQTVERKPSPWLDAIGAAETERSTDADFDALTAISQAKQALRAASPKHEHENEYTNKITAHKNNQQALLL